jgi:hypothetical protein
LLLLVAVAEVTDMLLAAVPEDLGTFHLKH